MKRVLLLSVSAMLVCIFFGTMPVQGVESSDKISREQEAILRDYEDFLDSLKVYVERWKETNPDASVRLEKAIDFAKKADVKSKMRSISELVMEDSWFNAGSVCMKVDSDLAQLEQILMGRADRALNLDTIKGMMGTIKGIHAEMKNALEGTGAFAKLEAIQRNLQELENLYKRQEALIEQIEGASAKDAAGLKEQQGNIKKQTEGVAKGMKGESGPMGQAGKATQSAAKNMAAAEKALGDSAGGSPSQGAGPGGGGKGEGVPGGKSAQKSGKKALKDLEKARAELKKAEAEALKEIEEEKYTLKELANRQREIAEQLNKLRQQMNKSGSGSSSDDDKGASGNIGRAQQKSKRAAKKLSMPSKPASGDGGGKSSGGEGDDSGGGDAPPGSGGGGDDSGASGAKKDQKDAIKEVEDAMAYLKAQMELLKLMQSLMKVEQALREMIKIQTGINKDTIKVNDEKLEWMEENPGRRFTINVLGRNCRAMTDKARNKEADLAALTGKMAKVLEEEGKMVFPQVLNMIKSDMEIVVDKLGKYDPGDETQLIEDGILRSLQRMAEAIHKDLQTLEEKMKEKQKQQQKDGQQKKKDGKPKKEKMLPALAEVKLLRIMQLEINFKTKQLDEMHQKRIGEINRLEPSRARTQKLRAAEDQKKRLSRLLASKESKLENIFDSLIKKIKGQR